ncbi:MAG TPA: response regulator [Pyrinomonadaceae bacterium]|nr:response regulator [Pyrinomonadaceae bacterium]
MEKLRVLIADDERAARSFLKGVLKTFDDVEIVGESADGSEAVEMIRALEPDLAFIDLHMPEVTGFDVVRMLSEDEMPLVAFVTAYDQYAIKAFELNAVDYLLKPIERERLQITLTRATDRLSKPEVRIAEHKKVEQSARSYEEFERTELIERIPVRKRDEFYLVPVAEVASIVADGELLRITTIENQRYEINFRLKDLEPRLDPTSFFRLSRGSVVNLSAISHITPTPGGLFLVALTNGQELPTSRSQSKQLRSRLLKL